MLHPDAVSIQIFGDTDHGCVREQNEDAFFIHGSLPLACVCDGMGGHNGGAEASAIVVDVFKTYDILESSWKDDFGSYQTNVAMCQDENNLVNLAHWANEQVHERSFQDAALTGMGSTLVALYVRRNKDVCVINVGDSRAYYIQDKIIRQMTNDHSLIEERRQSGHMSEELLAQQDIDHVITRAIGSQPTVEVDFFKEPIHKDYYLLCSDGLTCMLSNNEIHECVMDSRDDGHQAVRELIQRAKDRGGTDNVTAVLLKVQ